MGLFEDTNPKRLRDLLNEIHSKSMVLPDFQRDFVWDPSATQELIVSIANNYPAGSILRVRDSQSPFGAREFEGAPPVNGSKHVFLVLDGQQRLTSLYQAFYGAGDHRYYLNLKKLCESGDFEEAIFHERSRSKKAKQYESLEIQSAELTLPLSHIFGASAGYMGWMLEVSNPKPNDERIKLLEMLQKLSAKWIKPIEEYDFPVVTLSATDRLDALCTIFETLNRTGVKLSVFELLTARFWPQGIKLRELWEHAIADHPIIAEYEVDPYYLLQAISLACRTAPSCKRSDVLNLKAAEITEWWQKVVIGLAQGLEILRDDCKVFQPKWLPYQTMLVTLSAVMARLGSPKSAQAGANRERIRRWFWCAIFSQVYERAPNSQSARDLTEIITWCDDGAPPECVTRFRFDRKIFREITPRQRAIYRGTICLILSSGTGALDFHTQAVITSQSMAQEGIDDHHVFPENYLEKKLGIKSPRERDLVLNRTLINRKTNQMIQDLAPSEYLAAIGKTSGFDLDRVLESHSLPTGANSPLQANDYEAFLSWRENKLYQAVVKVTGLKDPEKDAMAPA